VLLVAGSIVVARAAGVFEAVELTAYDWFFRLRVDAPPDPRVVIVEVTEADIQALGAWPMTDGAIAETLGKLLELGPRAVGLDIYRDVPVAPGTDALDKALQDPRVVAVMKFGGGRSTGVPPPAMLRNTEQFGFNDILVDPGGVVRRGLLFLDDGVRTVPAFALRLALLYLSKDGVQAAPDPVEPAYIRLGRTTIRPLEANDGPYVGADASGYQFFLEFRSGGNGFESVPLDAVLKGTVDPRAVRDRIVLLGVTAESVKDDFYTPHSRGSGGRFVHGVAVHAHIASQLVRIGLDDAAPLATLREWQEALFIVLCAIGGGVAARFVRAPLPLLGIATAGLAALAGIDFALFLRGTWLPLVPPAAAWVVAGASVTAWRARRESVERAMLMQLFSRHVSAQVADRIWQDREQFLAGGRPKSQRLVVTALFTDLAGFTGVSEKVGPEALMEWLNEYMDAMAREVARHGGVIRQYAGDAIVVLFGVPVARTMDAEIARDARNAVECALAMGEALRELNRRRLADGRAVSAMRAGIFTGPAVAGTLGTERSEYVVVGDTVNTAARLENMDKELFAPDPERDPCRIFIGETTLRYLDGEFLTEWVGDVNLKGKEQSVAVHRVVGRRGRQP
jgi:adenylate cyclase